MCFDLAARTNNIWIVQVFRGSYPKNTPSHFFTVLITNTVLLSLLPASVHFQDQPGPEPGVEASRRMMAASLHEQERRLNPDTFTSKQVPAPASTRVLAQLHVCGADAVIIQTEREAAATGRLRLRAVPPTPTCRVSRRRQDPQAAAWRRWRSTGARGRGGEGV